MRQSLEVGLVSANAHACEHTEYCTLQWEVYLGKIPTEVSWASILA